MSTLVQQNGAYNAKSTVVWFYASVLCNVQCHGFKHIEKGGMQSTKSIIIKVGIESKHSKRLINYCGLV